VLGREALLQRLEPEPGREEGLERLGSKQQLSGAEPARIDDREPQRPSYRAGTAGASVGSPAPLRRPGWARPRCSQLEAHARVRRVHTRIRAGRLAQDRTCHTQVLGEM
jgi:hypothetical protein